MGVAVRENRERKGVRFSPYPDRSEVHALYRVADRSPAASEPPHARGNGRAIYPPADQRPVRTLRTLLALLSSDK
jgi:hypothetical protein